MSGSHYLTVPVTADLRSVMMLNYIDNQCYLCEARLDSMLTKLLIIFHSLLDTTPCYYYICFLNFLDFHYDDLPNRIQVHALYDMFCAILGQWTF